MLRYSRVFFFSANRFHAKLNIVNGKQYFVWIFIFSFDFCLKIMKNPTYVYLKMRSSNYCDGSPSLAHYGDTDGDRLETTILSSKSILFSSATARRHYLSWVATDSSCFVGFIYHHTTRNRTEQKAPPTRKLISRMTQKSHFTRRGIADPFLSSI